MENTREGKQRLQCQTMVTWGMGMRDFILMIFILDIWKEIKSWSLYWEFTGGHMCIIGFATYVSQCGFCQRNNSKAEGSWTAAASSKLKRAWEKLSRDLITQLSRGSRGDGANTVFVDRLSKMVHIAPTTSSDTQRGCSHIYTSKRCLQVMG